MANYLVNPLHQYSSYNYNWRFAALRQTEYNTGRIGFDSGIGIIETGGFPNKPAYTAQEQALGVSVEYFIDNVDMEYVASANTGTGFSKVAQYTFTITEPYSVGLFFQTLALTAAETGYQNYLQTPFLLANKFIGYDDAGKTHTVPGGAWCLRLVDVKFTVDASGSIYECTAIPYNHQAFSNTLQETRTNTGFSGATVKTVLDNLFVELNRQQFQMQSQGKVGQANAYRIEFPHDISTVSGGKTTYQSSLKTGEDAFTEQQRQDFGFVNEDGFIDADFTRPNVNFGLDPNLQFEQQQSIKLTNSASARAQIDPNSNDIGNAPIVQNVTDFGNNSLGVSSITWNAEKQIYQRGSMSINADSRQFFFQPRTAIEQIIEEVILTSEYGLRLINQVPVNEMIQWFSISSKIYIADPYETQISGSPAYEIVYIVTPYTVHRSHIMQGNEKHSYDFALNNANKVYRYSYTGENADIMDFQFTIDNSFYKDIAGTQNLAVNTDKAGNKIAIEKQNQFSNQAKLNAGTPDITKPTRHDYLLLDTTGGANKEENAVRMARIFNQQILNSNVDNIAIDLKIWGDPYYLNDSDAKNVSATRFNFGTNSNGHVDWQRGEVYILLDFKSAVDYNGNMLQIDPVNQFVGVYRLVTYRCSFENGIYTNTLSLLRMPGQQSATIQQIRQNLAGLNVNNNLILADVNSDLAAAYAPLMQKAQEFQEAYTHFQNLDIQTLSKIAPGNLGQITSRFEGLINDAKQLQNNLQKTADFLQNPIEGFQTIAKNFATGIEQRFKNVFGGFR